ncbi:uncharacterized protein UV8b_07809 [Ustilaginoidea virens]|uniref:Uncharacterized protein n=1 Tax=Ustilaginoidea virens TaxID=1159556 RepID=A0A8E5MKE3_USTVR|nr:uncharacterized protein UV8b_07809 [Ustilaginoidea virens]QUC23568.1 hypothetical protein UV8b_07809 [Ustilaginoidea virens]
MAQWRLSAIFFGHVQEGMVARMERIQGLAGLTLDGKGRRWRRRNHRVGCQPWICIKLLLLLLFDGPVCEFRLARLAAHQPCKATLWHGGYFGDASVVASPRFVLYQVAVAI